VDKDAISPCGGFDVGKVIRDSLVATICTSHTVVLVLDDGRDRKGFLDSLGDFFASSHHISLSPFVHSN
jgi:hypothetical protein